MNDPNFFLSNDRDNKSGKTSIQYKKTGIIFMNI